MKSESCFKFFPKIWKSSNFTPFTNPHMRIKAAISCKLLSLWTVQTKFICRTFLVLPLSSPKQHQMQDKELLNDLKCTCSFVPKNIVWYVKKTQFRSPLHQLSVKNIHQVRKIHFKVKGLRGDYQNSDQNSALNHLPALIPANNASMV